MNTKEYLVTALKFLYPKMRGYKKNTDLIIKKISDDDYISNLADKISDKLGIDIIKDLGGGQYGIAYELEDGRVFKITSDYTEIKVSYYLMRFLGFDTIFIIDNINNDKYSILGGIIQPKVDGRPLRDIDKNFARILKLMWESRKFNESTLLQLLEASPIHIKIFKSIKDQMEILREHGLLNFDFNPTNVLIDDDNNAHFIDFGGSSKINANIDISELGKPLAMEDKLMLLTIDTINEDKNDRL